MSPLLTAEEMSAQNGKLIMTDLGDFPKMRTEDLKAERKRWKWMRSQIFCTIFTLTTIKTFAYLILAIWTSMQNNSDSTKFLTNPFLITMFLCLGALYGLSYWGITIQNKIISIESVLWARWATSLPPDQVPAVYTYNEIRDPRFS